MGVIPSFIKPVVASAWLLAQANPARVAVILLAALYACYLPQSGYTALHYDANTYWELGRQYGKTGAFEFTSFSNSMRGYLFPLLLAPFAIAGPHIGLSPIELMRPLGVLIAALFFGALAPALAQAINGPKGPVVPLVRRLLFGALGFAFWRDYFNFSLSDFPALFALCLALWVLLNQKGILASLLAGIALGAAMNMRPVFVAALPFAAVLSFMACPPQSSKHSLTDNPKRWFQWVALLAGLVLVLAPQSYINQTHFNSSTPFVLARSSPNGEGLYLKQLSWGLQYQKYETNIGADYPTVDMNFVDPIGNSLLRSTGGLQLKNTLSYLELAANQPVAILGVWLRHLFNGMDLQYPTPYIKEVYIPSWPLAWLNYSVWLGGVGMLIASAKRVRPHARVYLALAALIMPCLAALPVAVECRFFVPLHMLLCAAVAFGAHPIRAWHASSSIRRVSWAALYIVFVSACFMMSAYTQGCLENGPRKLFSLTQITNLPVVEG
ncbi:hypothetical protein [Hymenobacter arizonensis]|uniref:Dolichyl-phosphate-mannose-protein mannosyltransferase n=1 Tax=Hymenobacter arizonensis TaxID=1227077 RepID=A0A1I5T5F5_HYMAR|nr:hypothetical protein [Hymenobacter arizonensis]SFP78270.1 hypothetical protein SAMN04515668_0325 [Hymenobacter arizonensis]